MKRPNVLLIYTDQQRADALGCMGNPHIKTPNLDKLAADGCLFTKAFCNNPVCMPSRQSMLTGQYPSAVGCCSNGVEFDASLPTIYSVLKPYGYHAAQIGKLHFLNHSTRDHSEPHPDFGFDTLIVSDEPGCYDDAYIQWVKSKDPSAVEACRVSTPAACITRKIEKQPRNTHQPYVFEGPEELTHSAFVADQTIEFLKSHKDDTFFAIAGFYAPHTPVNPPQRFVDMYDIDEMPLPAMKDSDREKLGLSDEQWRKVKAYYYALVSHVDDQIGKILDCLESLGLSDDTIVVFTSDHGEHLGDHGRVQKGPPGLDSCLHVPLIVRYGDKIKAGQKIDALVEAVDIVPTITELAGVPTPPVFQGRSFKNALCGEKYIKRSSVYMEWRSPFEASWKTVRTDGFKYCRSADGTEMLFDLIADPHELKNIAASSQYELALGAMRDELISRWFDVEKQYPRKTGAY